MMQIVAAITGRATVLTAPLIFTASEVLIGAAAIGVYRRSRWPRPVLLAHAVIWTGFAALFTLFSPPGLFGLLSLFMKSKAFEGDVSVLSAKLLFAAVWARVAWSWVIAIMVRRLMQPDINAAGPVIATKEQRALVGGVGLLAAYALLGPWLSGLVQPIRQIDATYSKAIGSMCNWCFRWPNNRLCPPNRRARSTNSTRTCVACCLVRLRST